MYATASPVSTPPRTSTITSSNPTLREPLLEEAGDPWTTPPRPGSKEVAVAKPAKGTSLNEAVYNVLNVYVGLGLLSKPYAVAQGGWLSLFALAALCAVANVTGKLIVRGFAKLPKGERSYGALGERAFGPAGRWLVLVVVTLEFCGALMVVLIFVWKNALLLAPWYLPDAIISERTVAILTTLMATPTVWALDFGSMAAIGFIGVVASVVIVVVVVTIACWYGFLQLSAGPAAPPPLELVGGGFPMAVGIFVLSLGGHAALPGIYSSMARPEEFDQMLDIALFAMFGIYAAVGLAGFVAYGWLKGEVVDVLITTNMAHDREGLFPLELPGHFGERTMSLESTLMTIAVVAKSFTAISPVTSVLAELPELLLLGESGGGADATARRAKKQIAVRTALLWLAAALAYPCSVYGGLALVEAVTGAMCSMLASLALPCACWVALYRAEVPASHTAAAAALAVLAVIAGAAFTTLDIVRFFEA